MKDVLFAVAGSLICLGLAPAWGAEPMRGERVIEKWPAAESWPVVDARGSKAAQRRVIPEAITYREGLSFDQNAVVVVAGDGQRAGEVATALEQAHPDLRAVPLKDGFTGLRALRGGKMYEPEPTSSALPDGATTPSGTCKPGEPLHTFAGDGGNSGRSITGE